MKIEIPLFLDDMPLSPEAFRVYFSVACHIAEYGEFPSVERITARCFGKKYALGRTHTTLALTELTKWNLIKGEPGSYQITQPEEWKIPGGVA